MNLPSSAYSFHSITKNTKAKFSFAFVIKMIVVIMTSLIVVKTGYTQIATDGDYRSAATGTWSGPSTWQTRVSGSWVATTTAPTSASNVYIQAGHTVTIDVTTAPIKDLDINNTGVLAIGTNTVTVSGKLRAYTGTAVTATGADGTFYSGQTNSAAPGANSITTTGAGKLSIIGSSRNITNTGEWGGTSTGCAIEVNMTSGQTATFATSAKAASWNIISGNVDAVSATFSADNGTSGGNITIAVGCTYSSNRTGASNPVFQRTGTTLGGTLTVNGTLRLTGTSPAIAMASVVLNGTVNYAGASQNLNTIPSGTNQGGAALLTTFNNLTFSGSGTKTLLNTSITVNGTLSFQGTAGFSFGTQTLSYGAASTLEYAGSAAQTASSNEWPNTAAPTIPTNVTINNPSGVFMNLNRTISGNFLVLAGDVQNSAGAVRTLNLSGASATLQVDGTITGDAGNGLNLTVSGTQTTLTGTASFVRFGIITVSGTSTLILNRDVQLSGTTSNVNGTLQINNGGSITIQNSAVLNYGGTSNLIYNNGNSLTAGAEWPLTSGPANVSLVAAGNNINLTADRTISNTLTLTDGVITTSANKVSVTNSNTLSVSRTNGYVVGNLQRGIGVGSGTYSFPVGTSAGYTPVSFVFSGTTGAGSILAASIDGASTNYPVTYSTTNRLNRYWAITNNGATGFTATATFNYLPGDLTGGATESSVKAYKFDAPSTFSYPVFSTNTNSFTVSGINSFSEFGAGECQSTSPLNPITGGGSPICIGATQQLSNIDAGYTWSSDDPSKATVSTAGLVTGIAAGTTNIRYSDPSGCRAEAIQSITVLPDHTITASAGTGGTISPNGVTTLCEGNGQLYTITADACYSIADVLVDGVSQGAISTYTFSNITANHTISATFSLDTYSITVTAGANGSISPVTGSVNCGSNATYTITPDACYSVADVIVDGVSQGAITTYTFNNVTAPHTISATFTINTPLLAPTVSGPVNVCAYIGTGDPITYTFNSAGATGYNYILPPNVSVVSSTSNSITLNFLNGFATQANKQIRVTALSACGNSPQTIYYLLAQNPNTPSAITASNSNICAVIGTPGTITYSIPPVVGATSYLWIAQAGTTTINHPNGPGVNDTLVTISFSGSFTSSNLIVVASNGCGTSGARSLTITRSTPFTPGLISGPTNACEYIAPGGTTATYTIAPVTNATSYTWTVPAGAIGLTGQGTNTISFTYPAGFTSGTVTVSASNGCGTSGVRSLSITKLNPATPGVIDVINTVPCPDRQYTYTIATIPTNATSLVWTVPTGAGAVLLSGQGTTSITVSYPGTAVSGNITVQALNNCGASTIRTLAVKLPACELGRTAIFTKGIETKTENSTIKVNVFPNPTVNNFSVQVLTAGKEPIYVRIMDMQGREYKKFNLQAYQSSAFGSDFKSGTYLMEVRQGSNVKTIKLLKF